MKQRILALSLVLSLLLSGCGLVDTVNGLANTVARIQGSDTAQSEPGADLPSEDGSASDQSASESSSSAEDRGAAQGEASSADDKDASQAESSAAGDKDAAQADSSATDDKDAALAESSAAGGREAQGDNSEPEELSEPDTKDLPWNLILVNRDHPIPKNYQVKLTTLSNGQKVDSRIYPSLQKMFDDARAKGLGLFVAAGYRTAEKQEQLLKERIAAYKNEGNSNKEAEQLAKRWVAVPGTSEHQLGIAVDINADTNICKKEDLYQWLADNSFKYGFIKRYPEGKTKVTGIINEPWHYRYVGKKAAKEMHEQNLCLEEYLNQSHAGS